MINDALVLVGAVLVVLGVAIWSVAASLIVAGVALSTFGIWNYARTSDDNRE